MDLSEDIFEKDYNKTKCVEELYAKWRSIHCSVIDPYIKQEYEPLISVVIPVYNVEDGQLRECVDSICNQTYTNWELYLVDDNSSWESVRDVLATYESNPKINVIYRKENGHISKATNDGIFAAKGEFIAFMDCDDVIEINALSEFVYYLNENPETDFVYSDEDKVSDEGDYYHNPFFKPDWSPDTMFSMMYTNHLAMYRREIVCKVGGLRTEYNGSQDYDLTLRFMEHSDNKRVGHIQKVLYHWRERPESAASSVDAKPYAIDAAGRAKEDAIRRRGIDGELEYITDLYQYRLRYHTPGNPLVSIIIPSKDNFSVLSQCIESLVEKTTYKNYEIIVVDNGSSEYNRFAITHFLSKMNVEYVYDKMDFNFSKMCNIGVDHSHGEYILFLNDDIEIIEEEWLDRMLGQAMRPHTGAVGAKLLYPNRTIQHVGLCNLPVGPSHMFVGVPDGITVNFCRNRLTFNWIAVTGACLMVSKEKYDEVGGFDEKLTVAYNDVDLCFKLYKAGYYNVSRMDSVLIHHESFSRGYDVDDKKIDRLNVERRHLFNKHEDLLDKDPFYNVNLVKDNINYDIDTYGIGLHNYDVKIVDDVYPAKPSNLNLGVDGIAKDNMVRIIGWAFSDDSISDMKSTRYVMLRNKARQIYLVPADKRTREDLKETFGIDNLTEGFECNIDRKVLATNIYNYDIGILQINEDGTENYVWSDVSVPHDGVEDINYSYYSREEDVNSIEVNEGMMCSIDSIDTKNMIATRYGAFSDMTYIRGWAYMPSSQSNNYRVELGLVNNETITLYDCTRDTRFDVADSLNNDEAYLSGFRCEIPMAISDDEKIYVILTDMRNGKRCMKAIR